MSVFDFGRFAISNQKVSPEIKLELNIGSDRSWVYSTLADFSEGDTPTAELFAIRFANTENAEKFKSAFTEAQAENAKIAAGGEPTPVAKVVVEEKEVKGVNADKKEDVTPVAPAVVAATLEGKKE